VKVSFHLGFKFLRIHWVFSICHIHGSKISIERVKDACVQHPRVGALGPTGSNGT
jgi:hypothetical protein